MSAFRSLRLLSLCSRNPIALRRIDRLTWQRHRTLQTTPLNLRHLKPDPDEETEIYVPLENIHALSVLRSRPEYSQTLYAPPKYDLLSSVTHATVKSFVELSQQPDVKPLDNEVHSEMVQGVLKSVTEYSDDDLLTVLHTLRSFPPCHPRNENFVKLWKGLDDECVRRFKSGQWTFDQLLVVDDAWGELVKRTDFHWLMIKKCFRRCERLNKEQFVRFMYSLNKSRKIHESINTYELEYNLIRLLNEMSADELAIVCLAFFKTETPIRDPVVLSKVLDIVSDKADTLDSLQVSAVAKAARLSSNFNVADAVLNFMKTFSAHVDRLSPTACLHVIISGSHTINVIDYEGLPKFLEKLDANFKSLRLKEIERLALVMTMFNVQHDSLYNKVVEELSNPAREKEIYTYGRCLPAIAHYLSFREIYPTDIINRVLAPEFQKTYCGAGFLKYRMEMLCLDMTVGLEVPEYQGNRLKETNRRYLLKTYTYWIRQNNEGKVTMFQSNLHTIAMVIEQAFNSPKKTMITSVLPQFHTVEIIFCTDKEGNAVDIPPYISSLEQWVPKILPKSAKYAPIIFHAFILVGRNNTIYKTNDVTGQTHLRERQIRKLGYVTHKVNTSEWLELSDDDRIQLVKGLVSGGVAEVRRRDEEEVLKASSS